MAKTAEEFLAHHGVMGMRWGQHTLAPANASSQDIYDARARISERNVEIANHQKSDSLYSINKVKNLRKANHADHHIAKQYANKKEAAARIQSGAAIAAGLAGVTLSKLAAHTHSRERGKIALASMIANGAFAALAVGAVSTQAAANKAETTHYNSKR